ncbi:MAG: DNA-deoxyinosine glycosylase [Anaerolineaceae bacterium]|nr:DNA-deoxyinosine glycosylase [Anaerolineaceae bacterium]
MNGPVFHPFEPIFDERSRVLILGTIPSPRSREIRFYYGHPQNRFWQILPDIFGEPQLQNIPEKNVFLLKHNIALWDVLSACDISGAEDSTIRNPKPNDLDRIFSHCKINAVFLNGQKAFSFYKRFFSKKYDIPCFGLPSTSPANCRNWDREKLTDAYRIILNYL